MSPPISRFATPPDSGLIPPDRPYAMPEEPASRRDFATLYRETVRPLRRYLSRLLGNAAEAQDVAHDAYLRVYPHPDKPAAIQPRAVLFTAARRLAINRLKRRSISPIVPAELNSESAAATAPGVAQEVMARQESDLLEAAIAGLPKGCRAVLLLRNAEMLSHREIAERLGIAVSTVEKQYARALRLLRAALPIRAARRERGDAPNREE
jgi:RNA polymerase sigma factor (sigma-70 family)